MPDRAGTNHTTGTKSKQESRSQQCKETGKRKVDNRDAKESEKEVRQSTKQMKKQQESPEQPLQETGKNTNKKKKTLKNKVTWQPLSKNNKEYFETIMDSVIRSVLRTEIKEKKNTQIHLNCLKERFLELCHKVSLGDWNSLKEVSNLRLKEMETLESNEEHLELLQEESEKALKATELISENIQDLQDKIRILENELEEEEEKTKQVLKIGGTKALSLPELPKKSIKAPILHEEILKRIPNQKDILKDLHVMNNSTEMNNMLIFIKEAYTKLDAS
ncbi:centromere protein Q [Dromiciops gliroides]|uniref:centromere protein Q n=1 Tax=Dromiciops gliroides TaxID=33562 RepID=UPI001CC42BB6|nr:centromere protein Q [Dromiciops gliroides]XP_043861059.1 centromere protein Q [Dromiciops gliroides]XP_043861060.1 centromere protein Q [Dromiciops gliroides]